MESVQRVSDDGQTCQWLYLLKATPAGRLVRLVDTYRRQPDGEWRLQSSSPMAATHILVQTEQPEALRNYTGQSRAALRFQGGWYQVALPAASLAAYDHLLAQLQQTPGLRTVEPDFLLASSALPNDPRLAEQWHLINRTQHDHDINALAGWRTRTNAQSIVVAVIDSGISPSHEDLKDNLWHNPGEIPGNGLDDDGNGIVDDIHGFSAYLDRGDSSDVFGHGTAVASVIGAKGNNQRGISGIAWEASLMALGFLEEDGFGEITNAVDCIDYAIDKGARIINASWNGDESSKALFEAIRRAHEAGIVFVTSAGNNGHNIDYEPSYPASFPLPNIVTVGNLNANDFLSNDSNYGTASVDLAAPGDDILVADFLGDDQYLTVSGTSLSAPVVAGVLALVAAEFPDEGHLEWIDRVLENVDPLSSLESRVATGGRINLARALGDTLITQPGTVGLSTAEITLTEGDAPLTLTVERSGGYQGYVRFELVRSTVAEFRWKEIRLMGSGQFTVEPQYIEWYAGENDPKTITVKATDDTYLEALQMLYQIRLSSLKGEAGFGTPSRTLVNLIDNEEQTKVVVTMTADPADQSRRESVTERHFLVTTNDKLFREVEVRITPNTLADPNGQPVAEAGVDYILPEGGIVLKIPLPKAFEGNPVIPITIRVENDTRLEPDENMVLTMDVTNGQASAPSYSFPIVDDDYTLANWLAQRVAPHISHPQDATAAADPDHDGFSNLQEYFYGTDPLGFNETLPQIQIRSYPGSYLSSSRYELEFEMADYLQMDDLGFEVQSSSDGLTWTKRATFDRSRYAEASLTPQSTYKMPLFQSYEWPHTTLYRVVYRLKPTL